VPLLDLFWTMLWFFIWIAWLILLFRVFMDIFRSRSSGGAKAGWVAFVVLAPFLGVFVYVIAHGNDMNRRQIAAAAEMQQSQNAYIRQAAGSTSGIAGEIEALVELRNQGVITTEEFNARKADLLA
jgi:hypothetical protein